VCGADFPNLIGMPLNMPRHNEEHLDSRHRSKQGMQNIPEGEIVAVLKRKSDRLVARGFERLQRLGQSGETSRGMGSLRRLHPHRSVHNSLSGASLAFRIMGKRIVKSGRNGARQQSALTDRKVFDTITHGPPKSIGLESRILLGNTSNRFTKDTAAFGEGVGYTRDMIRNHGLSV
jgi:hypothetical protein